MKPILSQISVRTPRPLRVQGLHRRRCRSLPHRAAGKTRRVRAACILLRLAHPKSVHGPACRVPRRVCVHLWNRHALCGKLQCEGGAEAPVVGGGAVTIRTTVPTRGGRRVLCKGVHVYSDIPDPGLALAGTTCGPRKICHNRECVNVSTLGFEACSSKCNAHGVCNSKGNCHCDPGWDPPLCDQPGNGGSVDSGPVPPATGAGVVAGVVVASLLVLGIALTALALKCLRRPDWSVTTVLGSFRIASSPANALVKMCGAKRSPDGREGN